MKKSYELIEKLGYAVQKEKQAHDDYMQALHSNEDWSFDESGERKLTPLEQKLCNEHHYAFTNLLVIHEEIKLYAAIMTGGDIETARMRKEVYDKMLKEDLKYLDKKEE